MNELFPVRIIRTRIKYYVDIDNPFDIFSPKHFRQSKFLNLGYKIFLHIN